MEIVDTEVIIVIVATVVATFFQVKERVSRIEKQETLEKHSDNLKITEDDCKEQIHRMGLQISQLIDHNNKKNEYIKKLMHNQQAQRRKLEFLEGKTSAYDRMMVLLVDMIEVKNGKS